MGSEMCIRDSFNLTSHLKYDEIPRKYLSFDGAIPRKLSAIPNPKQGDTSVCVQYEHCPRFLTFKIGIEVYSDIFFMVQLPINFS